MDLLLEALKIIILLLFGGAIGFFISRRLFQKQLKDNPPVNEKMIRAMYLSMGMKASEKKIRQTLNDMNKYN